MRLHQPATLKELMRQLILFAVIAGGARQHNEVDVMPRTSLNATHRNRMFQMEDVFPIVPLKFGKAIVASVVLLPQFLLDLRSCHCSWNRFLSHFTSTGTCLQRYPPALSLPIEASLCKIVLMMCIIADSVGSGAVFSPRLSVSCNVFFVDSIICYLLRLIKLWMGLPMVCSGLALTCFADRMESIATNGIPGEVFFCKRLRGSTPATHQRERTGNTRRKGLHFVISCGVFYFDTLFTPICKASILPTAYIKEIKGNSALHPEQRLYPSFAR